MNKPFISVIIMAYKREEFIIDAINSVIQQDLKKELYEIIVVTSFKNSELEKLALSKKIKSFYLDPSKAKNLGVTLLEGIKKSSGNVLCFLDDDDLFLPNKLSTVYNRFRLNKNLCYYKNNIVGIDKSGLTIKKLQHGNINGNLLIKDYSGRRKIKDLYRLFFLNYYFNSSSVSIRKSILVKFLPLLKTLYANPDDFIVSIALISRGEILIEGKKLTKYRFHYNSSRSSVTTYFTESISNDYKKVIKMHSKTLYQIMEAKKLRYYLDKDILNNKNIRFIDLIKYFTNYSLPYIIYCNKFDRFLILTLLYSIYRSKAKKILKKAEEYTF